MCYLKYLFDGMLFKNKNKLLYLLADRSQKE